MSPASRGAARAAAALLVALFLLPSLAGSAAQDYETFQKRLQAAVEGGNLDAIADAALTLAATADPRAVRPLVLVGALHPGDPVRSAVLQSLSAHPEPAWIDALGVQLRAARNDAEAIVAIEALGFLDHPAAAAPLVDAFQSVRPNILVTALRAARDHKDRSIIEACIELLERSERESGLIWAETRITLQAITGERYVLADDWRKWLTTRPEDWTPAAGGSTAEQAKTSVYRPERRSEGLGLPRIFGQEVPSTRVVFVLDTSKSMEEVDPTAQEEGASAGAGPTRLERAKRELIQAVEALRPEVHFNLLTYNTGVTVVFEEKLVAAKASAKRKAIDHVAALKPAGHTNSAEAILTAMDIPEVDTIIFISDGSPTIPGKGTMAEIPPILESIFVANRTKKITIHTLGFSGALVSFMKAIAHGTGGTYAPVK